MDPGKGEVITASSSFNNTISTANKAKQLVGKGAKVYLDASISSKEEAEARVNSLMEQMSYRLGSLEADCVGIPDLVPGRFIEISGMGTPVDNQFYLTSVIHDFTSDGGFRTQIKGCAAKLQTTSGLASAASGAAGGAAGATARTTTGAAANAASGAATGATGAAAGAASTVSTAASAASKVGAIAATAGMAAATLAPGAVAIAGMSGAFDGGEKGEE